MTARMTLLLIIIVFFEHLGIARSTSGDDLLNGFAGVLHELSACLTPGIAMIAFKIKGLSALSICNKTYLCLFAAHPARHCASSRD